MSRSYFDVVASLAAGEGLVYANLDRSEQQHVRSLKAEAFVKSVAKNGKAVLLNHPSAIIRLTADGEAYASLLVDSGIIAGSTPAAQPVKASSAESTTSRSRSTTTAETVQPAEKMGRHAKPEASVYAEIDERIAAREQAVKPATPSKKRRTRKAGPVVKSQGKPRKPVRQILDPQDLDALRRLAAVLPQIDQFTDQLIK
jgi:hypothetical protein